jgi:arylsulfatase A-like enzyme
VIRFIGSALSACSAAAQSIFILVNDLRWALSPHADRLSREGAAFVNALATTRLCSPPRARFLTGKYPHQHGIIDDTD